MSKVKETKGMRAAAGDFEEERRAERMQKGV